MSKVTSKRQVTLPKALADRYGIRPGDEIHWEAAGDIIRVLPGRPRPEVDVKLRLRLFDEATRRQRRRNRDRSASEGGRGWRREDLYDRGVAD